MLAASERLEREFLSQQAGFLRRDLVRKDDGTYVDVIVWQSKAAFEAAFPKAQANEAAGVYFAHMDLSKETPIEHATILTSSVGSIAA